MGQTKIGISLDEMTVRRLDQPVEERLFPNRSQAIEQAVAEKIERLRKTRLAWECAELSPAEEQAWAEPGIGEDAKEWPQHRTPMRRCLNLTLALAALLSLLVACMSTPTSTPTAPAPLAAPTSSIATPIPTPGRASTPAPQPTAPTAVQAKSGGVKVGFVYTGAVNDAGWNEAMFQGEVAVGKMPNVETIHAENVPENPEAASVMERMIQDGATIIFATSSGYPTFDVAKRHPDVTFFEESDRDPGPNVGTFVDTRGIWQATYLAGMAAGSATKSNKLGYMAGQRNPGIFRTVNAFHLGARAINPDVVTTLVVIGSWCDPAKNVAAAKSLASSGIDVIMQRLDCPVPAIQAAETAGVLSISTFFDDSKFAPNGWLTGVVLNWAKVFPDLVQQAIAGGYKPASHNYSLQDGVADIAPFGARVPKDAQDRILNAKEKMIKGDLFPFTGPLKDQSGAVRVQAGEKLDVGALESRPLGWFAEGIIGVLPPR